LRVLEVKPSDALHGGCRVHLDFRPHDVHHDHGFQILHDRIRQKDFDSDCHTALHEKNAEEVHEKMAEGAQENAVEGIVVGEVHVEGIAVGEVHVVGIAVEEVQGYTQLYMIANEVSSLLLVSSVSSLLLVSSVSSLLLASRKKIFLAQLHHDLAKATHIGSDYSYFLKVLENSFDWIVVDVDVPLDFFAKPSE